MKANFKSIVSEYTTYVKTCYRTIHAHPELSFEEYETSRFVCEQLATMGIEYRAGIAGTGVLGVIKAKNPTKKIIALRADMDALPICEAVDIPWKSERENVMHACGHDAHTACLLGAAKVLMQLRDAFEGTVLLIFQPGEEKAPGGARLMLEAGVFDEYKPELIIAQHVSVDYPSGTMGFLAGKIMASADEIHVKVLGKGGHGALPHLVNDTVLATAQTLVSLQQVRSRLCHPLTPMVLTFGRIVAAGAQNIIPHEVQLSGTLRTMDEAWRSQARQHIIRIINDTTAAYGCTAEITIPDGYPCVVNDAHITEQARLFATDWVGDENIVDLEVRMTSEDFAFFSQQFPTTFYRFGVKGKRNENSGGLHSAHFVIDEEALETGFGGMAWLAYRFLS
ncbi:MAG: N-acyl-L-amino acid amidohydrolase [Porphyromonadaceae bacterium CG2_30_38_12]|nr:MAG: N-acyl-L-amino acid amidohydrolase [Porphyromonadaceae bacterium CG2_30_38_12]